VTGAFSTATIVVGLVIAAWATVHLAMNRPVSRALQYAVLVLTGMFVVLAVGGIVQMVGTDREFARAEFVGYLLLSPLIPLGAWWWSRNDKSRAGSGGLLVIGLVMPVLVVRIQQVWAGV
jgi:hypothetical protein